MQKGGNQKQRAKERDAGKNLHTEKEPRGPSQNRTPRTGASIPPPSTLATQLSCPGTCLDHLAGVRLACARFRSKCACSSLPSAITNVQSSTW